MKITKTSRLTGIEHTLEIPCTMEDIERWQSGVMIQDAMPHLTPAQREFLMTGATQEEWDAAFPPEDD